ncbi:MAG: hypothetical protein ABSC11_12675 [Smithella sp.]|jgi:hypothetical protein
MRSFGMVIMIPLVLYMWMNVLVNLFISLKYQRTGDQEQLRYNIEPYEPPILEINFDKPPLKIWLASIIMITLCAACFFLADLAARDDLYKLFFSLNKEQTYILYYWAWKFNSLSLLIICINVGLRIFFNKKISFFKNIVILENSLLGKKSLVLDDNVRCSRASTGVIWLYNELSMRHIVIMNRRIKEDLAPWQQKLLDDFLSKIPDQKKEFFL